MSVAKSDLFHGLLLKRLLGLEHVRVTDEAGRSCDVIYACGCLATERDLDRFAVYPCPEHRDVLRAEAPVASDPGEA